MLSVFCLCIVLTLPPATVVSALPLAHPLSIIDWSVFANATTFDDFPYEEHEEDGEGEEEEEEVRCLHWNRFDLSRGRLFSMSPGLAC
jgi:hypothetical protein